MCNIYRNVTIADYFPLDLRNDKTDMLSHACVTKLSTKKFLLINEADRLRGQITPCWTWSSKTHFFLVCMFEGSVTSVMSSSLRPCGLQSTRLLCPWANPRGSPGKNSGVGCRALLQGIFRTRDRSCISHASCLGRRISYRLQEGLARLLPYSAL